MQPSNNTITISQWHETQPEWAELIKTVNDLQQTDWFSFKAEWHRSACVLVATIATDIAGFLYFVTQEIGVEEDHAVINFVGKPLLEAKVIAFGVLPSYRRHGAGRQLQLAAMELAQEQGCYQMRSHSSGSNLANHQLKLSLGFSVQPIIRGDDVGGVYFLKTLHNTHLIRN